MERIFLDYVLPCLWAFLACVGFTLVFNIHGVGKLICGFGGGLGWLVYLLAGSSIVAASDEAFSFLSLFPDGSGYLGQPDRVRRQPRRRQLRPGTVG